MVLAIVGALAVGAAGVAVLAGLPIWPLWCVVLVVCTAALSGRLGWTLSFTGSFIVGVLVQGLWLRVTPFLPVDFGTASALLWTVVGIGICLAVGFGVLRPRRIARSTALTGFAGSTMALVSVIVILVTVAASGTSRLVWAMANDAVTSFSFAQFMITDNGMLPSSHTNPVPFPFELLAVAMAPGRVAASGQLEHDVVRMAELWVLLVVMTSLLGGLLAARAVSSVKPVLKVVAGIAGGLFPLSWFVVGFTFEYGYFDATMAIAVFIACWIVWQESESRPVAAICVLLAGSTVLLGAWGPTGFISGGLAVVIFWRNRRQILGNRAFIVWVSAAVAQLVVYAILATLPDLIRESHLLGGEGGIFKLSLASLLTTVGLVLLLSYANRVLCLHRLDLYGVVTVIAVGTPVLLYFLWARRAAKNLWGYYPTKFAWVICVLLLLVAISIVARMLSSLPPGRGRRTIMAVGSILAILGIVFQTPPIRPGLTPLVPIVDVVKGWQGADRISWPTTLFALEKTGKKTFVVEFGGLFADTFYDLWLLQVHVNSGTDPIRTWAYFIDPTSSKDVCAVGEALGGGATVYTTNPGLEAEVAQSCGPDVVTVKTVESATL